MDDLIPEFIDETTEGLSLLDNDLVRLETDPANTALLDNAFRVMHTIKGTCGFIGLPRLEKMAHASENLMDKFRSGALPITERAMTVLFMSIDRVRYIVSEISQKKVEPEGNDEDIIAFIEQEVSEPSPKHAPPPAPSAHPGKEITGSPSTAAATAFPPASSPSPAPSASNIDKQTEYLRVHMGVVETLVDKASELVLTRNQLLQLIPQDSDHPLKTPFNHLCRLVSELQDSVMRARMQPIGEVCAKLPRLVRDLSTDLHKKITLEVIGEDTELDRQVLELVKDPLTHMLRNACDHGIETPQERIAAGKPAHGSIVLQARHEGGVVVITITDNGRGIDPERIARKALEKQLVTESHLARMSHKDILQFIMAPGFSTAQQITNVSGRGVGMDVVRANIEKIGGSVEIESIPGQGSTFTIQIPLTLAIISALIVTIDGLKYAIPQLNVQEVLALDGPGARKVETIHDVPVLKLRERIIPLLSGEMLFTSPDSRNTLHFLAGSLSSESLVAVVNAGSNQFGLILDTIHGTEEVVIKSLSPVLKKTGIFSGNTILGDGQVVMILDPIAIARRFHIDREALFNSAKPQGDESAHLKEHGKMLVFRAGDDIPKTLPLELVSRVQLFGQTEISRSGDHIIAVYDKHMIPLSPVDGRKGEPLPEHQDITTVILSDDMSDSAMGIIVDEIVGAVDAELDLSTTTARPGVLGSIILDDGTTADVVDITHYLRRQNLDWFSQQAHQLVSFAPVSAASEAAQEKQGRSKPAKRKTAKQTKTKDKTQPDTNKLASLPAITNLPHSDGKRVLVVDDSNFFRNLLFPILRSAGYDVALSHDPLHAIERHDRGEMFDVILSDIEMPHMNGYEFVERMRRDSAWKDLPFIAITSHNTADDINYGHQKGFDEYIGKFDKTELIRTMATARRRIRA